MATHNIAFLASVENAFNKRYWSGAWYGIAFAGGPRTVKLVVSVDFYTRIDKKST